jgi:hypothetical protein
MRRYSNNREEEGAKYRNGMSGIPDRLANVLLTFREGKDDPLAEREKHFGGSFRGYFARIQ